MTKLLDVALNENQIYNTSREKARFFGGFSTQPTEFLFLPDEKHSLHLLCRHVKSIIGENNENLSHFLQEIEFENMSESVFGLTFKDDIARNFAQLELSNETNASETTPAFEVEQDDSEEKSQVDTDCLYLFLSFLSTHY